EPPALTEPELQGLVDAATCGPDGRGNAIRLFVALAKAQPFGDGNKRTALLVANAGLIAAGSGLLLVVPVDRADQFNDMLARAYLCDEHAGVTALLRTHGFMRRS
ncbi:MAG: Fic family protein, partial [Gordonia amarae]